MQVKTIKVPGDVFWGGVYQAEGSVLTKHPGWLFCHWKYSVMSEDKSLNLSIQNMIGRFKVTHVGCLGYETCQTKLACLQRERKTETHK